MFSVNRLAEAKKEEGNALFKQNKYEAAIPCYTEAHHLNPNVPAYVGNRGACYLMLSKIDKALEDAQTSTRIDSQFIKGYTREAKCHVLMGNVIFAQKSLDNAAAIDPTSGDLKKERVGLEQLKAAIRNLEPHVQKKDYRSVVYYTNKILEIATHSTHYRMIKAEALAYQKKYNEASDMATDILRGDSLNVEALYIRGMVLYYQDNIDKAFQHFQTALKLSPEHKRVRELYKLVKLLKTKKEAGNEAFKASNYDEAFKLYTEALEVDPLNTFTNAKLYFNRCLVNTRRQNLDAALGDCTKAIELDENYLKAFLRRAKIYQDMEMFEESVRDYEAVYKKEKTLEHKRLLDEAKVELKKSLRKDYYKILGVQRGAGEDDIKRAYKKRALIHHPDRHANATETEKREQEKKFKELGEAYAVLSDSQKRSRYDRGADDVHGGGGFPSGYADIDPNNIFNAFFSGNGGGPFGNFGGFQQGGHGGGHTHFQYQ